MIVSTGSDAEPTSFYSIEPVGRKGVTPSDAKTNTLRRERPGPRDGGSPPTRTSARRTANWAACFTGC